MEIAYDSKADALSITFKKGKVFNTIEIAPEIILDLDKNRRPLYLEIIGLSEKVGNQKTSEVTMKNLAPATS